MFAEAHRRYADAKQEIDYIVSILLSGGAIGIIGPLLKEQGGHTTHELLARISNVIAEPGDTPAHEGMFREIYNSLKHAGNKRQSVAASNDLEIRTDLRREAAYMLHAARDDFRNVGVSDDVRRSLSGDFLGLLESEHEYV